MATLSYTDIKSGVFFRLGSEVYETLESTYKKKSRQKGVNQIKIRNLRTGGVVTKALHSSDKPEGVFVDKKNYIYIFLKSNEVVVHPEGNPRKRVSISATSLENIHLLPTGEKVVALLIDDEVVTLRLPIKVDITVKEAPPAIKGNTTQGGSKRVITETGSVITTPLFIETGDTIRVNTQTGAYVERISKAG